jgi:flavin reductase (DIM6/NTAB) family NADH-FMN oxidoreductase RutF
VVIECKLLHIVEIGQHTQFVGEIMDIKAEEAVLGEKGTADILKVKPFVFDAGQRAYYGIGEQIGKAFLIGKRD